MVTRKAALLKPLPIGGFIVDTKNRKANGGCHSSSGQLKFVKGERWGACCRTAAMLSNNINGALGRGGGVGCVIGI